MNSEWYVCGNISTGIARESLNGKMSLVNELDLHKLTALSIRDSGLHET
eukprot:CAMPEP_0114006590 /NCGR_PEP_ID=MMETSP0372-20130328/4184_1 /TAXON_ID=340204 /ORGANISM="Lankesteria abbotti" /LENGTH=48 /assembly_acc=CAM_ASM_000359